MEISYVTANVPQVWVEEHQMITRHEARSVGDMINAVKT
jgi:hypothetical protein